MNKYRILTNGNYVIIQKKCFGILWLTTKDLFGASIALYESEAQAKAQIEGWEEYAEEQAKKKGPWKIIKAHYHPNDSDDSLWKELTMPLIFMGIAFTIGIVTGICIHPTPATPAEKAEMTRAQNAMMKSMEVFIEEMKK